MIFDDRTYRRNRYLGYRAARSGDKYAGGGITHEAGEDIPEPYVVVFRIKDAPTIDLIRNGHVQTFYKPNEVTSEMILPLAGHSLTNLALGTPQRRKGGFSRDLRFNVGSKLGHLIAVGEEYIEQAHYLVKDGVVYQWTSRRALRVEEKEAA